MYGSVLNWWPSFSEIILMPWLVLLMAADEDMTKAPQAKSKTCFGGPSRILHNSKRPYFSRFVWHPSEQADKTTFLLLPNHGFLTLICFLSLSGMFKLGKLPGGSSKINRLSLNRCPPYTEIFSKRRKIYSVCVESLRIPVSLLWEVLSNQIQ